MPAEQSLRANDDQGVSPIEEIRLQGQSDSGDRIDAPRLDAPFDIQSPLSTKEKILLLDRTSRAQCQPQPQQGVTNQGE